MKKTFIVIGILIICIVTLFGSVHLFGRHIYNTRSCKIFNIDNIELRTGVNIPKVTSSECQCTDDTKISKFVLDTEHLDVNDYLKKNKLMLVDNLYIKENDNENSTYKVIFNQATSELTVNLIYKN